MKKQKCIALISILVILFAWSYASGASRDLKPGASDEKITQRAMKRIKPLWKIPLGAALVEDMRYVERDRLLVSLKKDFPGLPNLDLILIDTPTGKVLWRFDRTKTKGDFNLLAIADGTLVYNAKDSRKGRHLLLALSSARGTLEWSKPFKNPETSFSVLSGSGIILALENARNTVRITAINLKSGSVKWQKEYNRGENREATPFLLGSEQSAVLMHGSPRQFSAREGKNEWLRDDLTVSMDSALPLIDRKDLFFITGDNSLVNINSQTGKTAWTFKVAESIKLSNIHPTKERVFLRGISTKPGGSSSPGAYITMALLRKNGKRLWSFSSAEPGVSNVIQRGEKIYFGTTTSLVAINMKTGKKVFESKATNAGWLYPVKIGSFPDRIVYIGEFIVVGFDPETGKKLFTRGTSPVSSETDLLSLDSAIPRLKREIEGMGLQKTDFGSSYAFNQMKNYQHQAYLARTGSYTARSKSYYESHEDFQRNLFLYLGTAELVVDIGRYLEAKSIKTSIAKQMLLRNSIIKSHALGEIGEYVYRPDRKWRSPSDDFIGISIIHLPTGKERFIYLSPTYLSYGLWNLLDYDRKVVYHHGIGLDPADYEYSKPRKMFPYGKVRTIKNFLIAVPVNIPQ